MMSFPGDQAYDYPYDIPNLAIGANLQNEGIRTDIDSDFLLLGLVLDESAVSSLLFSLLFKDSSGNYFSSKPVMAANYASQPPAIFIFPGQPRIFPPGSSLGIGINNLSGATLTGQFLFRGKKRRVPPQPLCGPEALSNRLLVRAA